MSNAYITKSPKNGVGKVPNALHKRKARNTAPLASAEELTIKPEKSKKHKNIIDYSGNGVGPATAASSTNHSNTFGKVQRWLLESPIVAQPLSHIEHSSKVHKIMRKSQSTPERLVQKSPKKSKSSGNLAANNNEKVKLQVVYKPPFKFAFKLSKNSSVKTHVIGGGLSKSKKVQPQSQNKRLEPRHRRSALLIRPTDAPDTKTTSPTTVDSSPKEVPQPQPSPTINNYETLNPKQNDPHYENLRKLSGDNGLCFGSTQNLIPTNQGNISRSKKRSSLNLKSSTHVGEGRSTRRSSSNQQLNLKNSHHPPPLKRSSSSSQGAEESLKKGGSFNNIPRASLVNPQQSVSQAFSRPHTAACDESRNFEWPPQHLATASSSSTNIGTGKVSNSSKNSSNSSSKHKSSRRGSNSSSVNGNTASLGIRKRSKDCGNEPIFNNNKNNSLSNSANDIKNLLS